MTEARRHTYGPVGRSLQWPRGEKIMAWVRVGGSEMDINGHLPNGADT